jgi:hypothetical protein
VATLVALAAPRVGVTRVGELLNTTLPVPVDVVTPVPPLATGRVPDAVDTFTGGRMLESVAMLAHLYKLES